MKTTFNILAAMGVLVFSQVEAGVLLTEDFSYADGNLVGNGGWTNHSGSGSFIQVAGGAAQLAHGGGSREDAGVNFASLSSGILTASFDLTVNAASTITSADNEYFAHFMQDGSFNFRARLDVVAPTGAGDFTLGISSGSSSADATLGVDFSFNEVVSVVIAFDLGAGIGSLTAGGETISGTGIFLGETLDRFALRQSNSDNDESITVDNLVISAVPLPAGLPLLISALAGLGLLRRRS